MDKRKICITHKNFSFPKHIILTPQVIGDNSTLYRHSNASIRQSKSSMIVTQYKLFPMNRKAAIVFSSTSNEPFLKKIPKLENKP